MKAYNIKPVEIKLESNSNSFTVLGLSLGEQGRGRQRTIVPVERESQLYNIGKTKTGNPKLFAGSGDSDGWIARISCEGCYTRDTNGRASATEGVAVIARGHGAEGDAGRLGTWDDLLLSVPDGAVVKVKPHGGSKRPAYFLHFTSTEVKKVSEDMWEAYLDANDLEETHRKFL